MSIRRASRPRTKKTGANKMIKKASVWVLVVLVVLASALMLASCGTGQTETGESGQQEEHSRYEKRLLAAQRGRQDT